MNFFSSPPLRAHVGADDCLLLGTDPQGLRGRPYDSTQRMTSVKQFKSFSPACVKWIAIPTYITNPDGSLFKFLGLDALGNWWIGFQGTNGGVLFAGSAPGSDNRNWFEKAVDGVAEAILKYGIPIIAAGLATTGVGAVGAVALLAWRNLAQGQELTEAIMNAQQTKLSKLPSALEAFNSGLEKAQAGLSEAALKAAAAALPSAGTSTESQKAFYEAVQLVRAKQVQDLTLGTLGTVLKTEENALVRLALQYGAPLSNVMSGIRGKPGDLLLSSTTQKTSAFVAANVATPAAITKALSTPTTLRSFAPATPMLLVSGPSGAPYSGGGGGGGSSMGIGTVAVVGVGGFFAWRWWQGRRR